MLHRRTDRNDLNGRAWDIADREMWDVWRRTGNSDAADAAGDEVYQASLQEFASELLEPLSSE